MAFLDFYPRSVLVLDFYPRSVLGFRPLLPLLPALGSGFSSIAGACAARKVTCWRLFFRVWSSRVPLAARVPQCWGFQILGETWACLIQRGPGFLLGFELGRDRVFNEGTRATKGSRDDRKGKI